MNLDGYVTGTAGGVWSGTGVSGNTFDPSYGTQSVTYTVNPGGCDEVSVTQTITVTGSDASCKNKRRRCKDMRWRRSDFDAL